MEMTIITYDTSERTSLIPEGKAFGHGLFHNVVVRKLTLYNAGYRLRPAIVRGCPSMVLESHNPGESGYGYRPVMKGLSALKVAMMLQKMEPWTVDSERINERWTETGEYTPDYWDVPDYRSYEQRVYANPNGTFDVD